MRLCCILVLIHSKLIAPLVVYLVIKKEASKNEPMKCRETFNLPHMAPRIFAERYSSSLDFTQSIFFKRNLWQANLEVIIIEYTNASSRNKELYSTWDIEKRNTEKKFHVSWFFIRNSTRCNED